MKLFQQYSEYLKDNPNGYWFKRKLYGWGWTPARSQGWLTLALYIGGVIFFATKAEENQSFIEASHEVLAPVFILTIILIFVCYLKGEKPKWQWGKRED